MWIGFCCLFAVFPWSCMQPCQASCLSTWLFERKKGRKEREKEVGEASGGSIKVKYLKRELRPQLWLISARRRWLVFNLTFIVRESLPFDLWITNLAWWRKPLQAYQGKDLPQIRDLFFLMQVCKFATEVEIWKSSVRPKFFFLLQQHLNHCQSFDWLSWITRSAGDGSTEYVKLTFHGAEEERSQLVPSSFRALNHSWRFNSPQSQINSEFHFFCAIVVGDLESCAQLSTASPDIGIFLYFFFPGSFDDTDGDGVFALCMFLNNNQSL